jgi:hypothetical protein
MPLQNKKREVIALRRVFVDAQTRDELIVVVECNTLPCFSLTPYIDKGFLDRKHKRDALEAECCAIHTALKNLKGNFILYSDRKDLVDYLNGEIKSSKIEKKLAECIREIKELSKNRTILFEYIPRNYNLATREE